MKLDVTDKKLLTYLYHHYRDSVTNISKTCRLSKDQVRYRMRKYEEEIILKYVTLYDYNLFGYQKLFFVWITCKNKEEIREALRNTKNVLTYEDVLSKWDLLITFIFRNTTEFEELLNEFLVCHKDNILRHGVSIISYFEFFDLKTFGVKSRDSYKLLSTKKEIAFSKTDIAVLKALEHNGRAKVIDIARKADISSVAVIKKLKKFKEKGVIQGVRLLLDMEKLGYFWGTLYINLRTTDKNTVRTFVSFCREHPHVNGITFGIGEYNCVIQIFYQGDEDLRSTIRDLREKFREDILEYIVALIENEGEVRSLPFL